MNIKDLKEASVEELMQELRFKGWCTDGMWHVDDVLQNYECTSQQAMSLLEEVMKSERYREETFNAIDDEAEHMEYHKIYDNDGE